MKGACAWVAGRQGNIHPYVKPLIASLKTTAIADVASSFCDLQEARHDADYDHLATLSKPAQRWRTWGTRRRPSKHLPPQRQRSVRLSFRCSQYVHVSHSDRERLI
jgi:hypothetical protein